MKVYAITPTTAAITSLRLHYRRIVSTHGMSDRGLQSGELLHPVCRSVIANASVKAIENLPLDPNKVEWDFENDHVVNKPKWAIDTVRYFIKVCKRENLLIGG